MDPHAAVADDEASKDPGAEKHKLSFDEKDFEGIQNNFIPHRLALKGYKLQVRFVPIIGKIYHYRKILL